LSRWPSRTLGDGAGCSSDDLGVVTAEHERTIAIVSDTRPDRDPARPHGTVLLPRDLTAEQLRLAPVLGSVDRLLVDRLTDVEDEAFARAIGT
jgi:hypothetical protein